MNVLKTKINNSWINHNKGMSYVELVVVLGIFGVLSSVVLFNHGAFQGNIDIRTLSNDVALKIVEAQKNATSGKYNINFCANCKPSYGIYFNMSTPTKFVYFADLDNDGVCGAPDCLAPNYNLDGEVSDIINITKANYISNIAPTGSGCPATVTSLTVTFRRPNASPMITTSAGVSCVVSDVSVDLSSPRGAVGKVRIFPSGRIQLN